LRAGLKLHNSINHNLIASNTTETSSKNFLGDTNLIVKYKKLSTFKEYFDVPGPVSEEIEVVVSIFGRSRNYSF